jgi:hypothetical protein
MKTAHVIKFRRALLHAKAEPHFGPPPGAAAAESGGGGTLSVFEAVDGWRGTFAACEAHEDKLLHLAHALAAHGADEQHDRVLVRLYEAPDGFRGTYDEVLAHEEKLGMVTGNEKDTGKVETNDRVLMRLYEAPDGFRGTYDEVLAHEQKLGLAKGDEQAVDKDEATIMHLYEVTCFTPKLRLTSTHAFYIISLTR